ncbi:MAG: aspartate kinase, partial [Duodenibacillus sp.]|nr:aspartate kinase [Duodenibacillus sp.]
FTDVDGVYTTDPRIEPAARRLDVISFEEMLELASLGSKVLQIRSVEFAGKYHVPLRVLSSLTDPDIPVDVEAASGTLISFEEDPKMEKALVSGIACTRDESKITLVNVPDTPGIAYKILGPVAAHNIDVDMIVQNVGAQGTTDFTFTVPKGETERALKVIEEEVAPVCKPREVAVDKAIAKVSIVGIGMRSHAGVACRIFETLASEGINIQMIGTSEIKVSVVVEDKYMELAVRALHQAFGLAQDD